jgi:hypothetical protein
LSRYAPARFDNEITSDGQSSRYIAKPDFTAGLNSEITDDRDVPKRCVLSTDRTVAADIADIAVAARINSEARSWQYE